MWIRPLSLWFSYSIALKVEAKPPDSLRMVHYIFRHGERTPGGTYKGDPNPPSTWPKGYYQLTQNGIRQQYELGKYFRKRYDGFISEVYFPNETRIRSTSNERCLMSASAHSAGLYPPKGEDVWNKEIQWQPIPVFTKPQIIDYELSASADCPFKHYLLKDYFNSEAIRKLTRPYDQLFKWLSQKLGQEIDIINLFGISDTLRIENNRGLPLPDFVNDTVIQNLTDAYKIAITAFARTKSLRRIVCGGGPFLKDIIERMRVKIAGKLDPDYRLYIYSDHDASLVTFLVSLGMYDDVLPDYCATVIIELHEMKNQHYLKILYKNDTQNDPIEMKIANCDVFCPFDKFVDLTKDIIPDDIEKECHQDGKNYQFAVLAVFVLGVVVIVISLRQCGKLGYGFVRNFFSFENNENSYPEENHYWGFDFESFNFDARHDLLEMK